MVFILFLDKKNSLNMLKFYHIFYVTESPHLDINLKKNRALIPINQ